MRRIITFCIICFGFVLISGTSEKSLKKDKLLGVWELESQYTYNNNNIADTIHNKEGYRQIKMYSIEKVMWSRFVPQDSIEWYAYGTYMISKNKLTEKLESVSASMMRIIDTMRIFSFKVEVNNNSFRQIIMDNDGNAVFSENYKRLE